MLCDYHVHTAYSDDSDYPMEDIVKDAIALGINELCFTDHVDYGIKTDFPLSCPKWWRRLSIKTSNLRSLLYAVQNSCRSSWIDN